MAKKQPQRQPGKSGRPTKFSEKLAAYIIRLAAQRNPETGEPLTEDEIAAAAGICRATLALWKGKHPGFSDAVQQAKNMADEMVEVALFQRAIGYQHPAIKMFYDSETGKIVTQQYVEQYPPDTAAAKFYLSNRRPKRWRDVQKHEHSGKVTLEDLVAGEEKEEGNE